MARRAGATRIILETGTEQPEAVALYRALDYRRIPPYGEYSHDRALAVLRRGVATRVLVISGTMGAGKSAVASAIGDLPGRAGRAVRVDRRRRVVPGLAHRSRRPVQPAHALRRPERRRPGVPPRGLGKVILARVVEDPDDRERYARAFRSEGGPAEVTVVRVTAPEEVRLARIDVREPEGSGGSSARTNRRVEDALDALDLDDFVFENGGPAGDRDRRRGSRGIGWGPETF